MNYRLFASSGLLALLVGSVATAQPASDSNGATTVEDVVVTAQRREQRLQDVPVAITAVTANELARSGVSDTRQLTQAIPALNFTRASASIQPTLRGVGTRGTGPGDEANVSVYIDGVYQPTMSTLGFNLLNVERVEVLRGPQGTLFGRNSTGGLVNVITSDPEREFSGRLLATVGNYGEKSIQSFVTGPLAPTLSANLNMMLMTDDGYLRDISRGGVHVNAKRDLGVRGKLLFQPTDDIDFKLTLGYSNQKDGPGLNSFPLNGNTRARALAVNPRVLIPTKPWTVASTLPIELRIKQKSAAFDSGFDLSFAKLETTTGYQTNQIQGNTDSDGTPQDVTRAHSIERSRYFTQEVRLLSQPSSDLSWIVGGFYFNGRGQFKPLTSSSSGVGTFITTDQRSRSLAGFAEASYEVAPKLTLTAGARYTSEKRRFSGMTERPLGTVIVAGGVRQEVNDVPKKFNQWTYRAALQYAVSDDVNAYASFSRGFKSGVFNSFSTNPLARATDPETLNAYEVGLKTDPLPWLRANFAAFHYDYSDIQLSARDAVTTLVVLLNAASADVDGGEVELTAAVTPNFNLRAYATILKAQYAAFPAAQAFNPVLENQTAIGGSATTPVGDVQTIVDASGRDLLRAPRSTFGLSGDYSIDTSVGTLGIAANVFHSAKYYWDFTNRLTQPSYTLVNGEISLKIRDDQVKLSIWGRNLTDEVVYQSMIPAVSGDMVTFDRPRTYGVSALLTF